MTIALQWVRWYSVNTRNILGYPSVLKKSLWHVSQDGDTTLCGKKINDEDEVPSEHMSQANPIDVFPRTPPDDVVRACQKCTDTISHIP